MSEDYLRLSRHPAYRDSSLVQNAAAASRLIVTGTSYLGNMMTHGAETFTNKTQPAKKPMNFTPAAHERVRKINSLTQGAAHLSAKTVGSATKHAQNLGASLARKGEKKNRADQEGYKPGFLNKSMIAFSTIADGIAYSGKQLLTTSGAAATTVVGHRWGDDAGKVAAELAGGVKNVGLVYIDVTGVSRRAVIKSVAKGMVVGRVKGGGEVVVGGGDGGDVPEDDWEKAGFRPGKMTNNNLPGASSSVPSVVAFRNQAGPPSYSSSTVGEPLGQGYPPEKNGRFR
jgi:spartin